MKDNSGPAFPQTIDDMGTMRSVTQGMTLRQWYAGMATDNDIHKASLAYMENFNLRKCTVAEARFFHADSMIKEGKK